MTLTALLPGSPQTPQTRATWETTSQWDSRLEAMEPAQVQPGCQLHCGHIWTPDSCPEQLSAILSGPALESKESTAVTCRSVALPPSALDREHLTLPGTSTCFWYALPSRMLCCCTEGVQGSSFTSIRLDASTSARGPSEELWPEPRTTSPRPTQEQRLSWEPEWSKCSKEGLCQDNVELLRRSSPRWELC